MEKENLILEVKPEISTKEIENELIEKKVISEEQVENSLNYEKLSDAEKSAIDELTEHKVEKLSIWLNKVNIQGKVKNLFSTNGIGNLTG